MKSFIFASTFLIILLSCKDSSNGSDNTDTTAERMSASAVYFQQSTTIDLEVWYQTEAKPYVRETPLDRDLWQILRGNLTAIFQYRTVKPTIVVPSELSGMNELTAGSQENWSTEQILTLWRANQKSTAPAGTARFYVYFLDGYLNEDGASNKNVIGVQIGDYPVLAIFKPVIAASSQGGLVIPKFMEQSTLVHEMGHALGFVNHGVPMQGSYQDSEHGAHSTDTECVMYWLNEGTTGLRRFVQKLVTEESAILWGQNVLNDAKSLSR
ncbi:MAG: hypothetical protein EOP04_26550 [Proteobacteria bacterium]|nr:MAG: hypothetical protein EOP04_26550 [Pseudomonadota bacterium]